MNKGMQTNQKEEIMGLLDYHLDDVPELETVPAGEYLVRITKGEVKEYNTEKGSGSYLAVAMQIVGEEDAKPVFENIFLPGKDDDKQRRNGKLRKLRKFYEAFAVDYSQGVDPADLQGKEGYVYLKVTPATGDFEEKNEVTRYIIS
jgi:hypothetical protein